MTLGEESKGHIALVFFSFFVAGTYSLGQFAAPHIDPTAFMAIRFLFSALLMGFIVWLKYPIKKSDTENLWRYLVLGSIFAFYFAALFEGLSETDAISISAMFTITPFITAGFAYLILQQKAPAFVLVALLIAAIGALWVIFKGDLNALIAFDLGRGEKIFFWGVVSHALYIPLSRKWGQGESVAVFTFGVLVGGTFPLILFSYDSLLVVDWVALPSIVWSTLAYMVVFPTAIAFALLQYSNQRLPSVKVMAYTYLIPSWVIVWNTFFGLGIDDKSVLIGIALTVIAMMMLLRK